MVTGLLEQVPPPSTGPVIDRAPRGPPRAGCGAGSPRSAVRSCSLGLMALALARAAGLVELAVVAALCLLLVGGRRWCVVLLPSERAGVAVAAPRPHQRRRGRRRAGCACRTAGRSRSAGRSSRCPAGRRPPWVRLPTLRPRPHARGDDRRAGAARGVITVGPVLYRRTDPVGLFAPAGPLGRGGRAARPPGDRRPRRAARSASSRDLEGVPSDQLSMSDLAFHALREYVPGDDLRHVHWRSSARGRPAARAAVPRHPPHLGRRCSSTPAATPTPTPTTSSSRCRWRRRSRPRAARDGYDLTLVCGDRPSAAGTRRTRWTPSAGPTSTTARDLPDLLTRGLPGGVRREHAVPGHRTRRATASTSCSASSASCPATCGRACSARAPATRAAWPSTPAGRSSR